MVFARRTDGALASLVKTIDNLVAKNTNKQLASVVAFVGSDAEALQRDVANFATTHGFQNVVLAIPKEHDVGHRRLGLDPNAAVTVMVYQNKTIVANAATTNDGLTNEFVEKVAGDITKVLR